MIKEYEKKSSQNILVHNQSNGTAKHSQHLQVFNHNLDILMKNSWIRIYKIV